MNRFPFNLLIACGILLAAAVAHAQSFVVGTLAGQPTPGSADGTGGAAQFHHPNGLAVDAAGNVFVADTVNSTIRKISTNGQVSTFAGQAGNSGSADGLGTNALFYAPQGITMDSTGNLYVADTGNGTIRIITAGGVVTTLAGVAGNYNSFDGIGTNALFYEPQAVAVDDAGNVFVADTWNHTIRKITSAGAVSTLAGLAGNFGAADGTNSKARFNWPSGIALDGATNLFVTDFLNHTIRKITPGGKVTTVAGLAGVWGHADGTNSAARFFQPQGISADNAGNLFVVDSGNQTIRKASPVGTNWVVTTIAGFSGNAGSDDGTGSDAQFYFPCGIARDDAGRFYVADSGNNMIRTGVIAPPRLRYAVSTNGLILSWPASATGFLLESTGSLLPEAVWTSQTNGVMILGEEFIFTKTLTNGAAFYRLRGQ